MLKQHPHTCCTCYNVWGPPCSWLKCSDLYRSDPPLSISRWYIEYEGMPSIVIQGDHKLGRGIVMLWDYSHNITIHTAPDLKLRWLSRLMVQTCRHILIWVPYLQGGELYFEDEGRSSLEVQGCWKFARSEGRMWYYFSSISTPVAPTMILGGHLVISQNVLTHINLGLLSPYENYMLRLKEGHS